MKLLAIFLAFSAVIPAWAGTVINQLCGTLGTGGQVCLSEVPETTHRYVLLPDGTYVPAERISSDATSDVYRGYYVVGGLEHELRLTLHYGAGQGTQAVLELDGTEGQALTMN